jgi:hypothetical protein
MWVARKTRKVVTEPELQESQGEEQEMMEEIIQTPAPLLNVRQVQEPQATTWVARVAKVATQLLK